ncbi:MAG: restriction system protein [Flavobacteriales bacterium]|jgi:restriction system protein
MDISPILSPLFSSLWYLIPVLIVVSVLKSPWFKGVMGEFQVNLLIKLFLPKKYYHLIKNVTLPTEDGTTQIDHIVVSKMGIFVIETKNMKGWIFGTPNQKQWTQKIFKHSSKFQNPLHQNYKHTKTIENCLGVNPEHINSVIVFTGDSSFKTKMPENVTYSGGCVKYIKSKKEEVLTQNDVKDIINKIEAGRLQRGIKTNLNHIAHVKKIVQSKEKDKPENPCPKCGSEMVIRKTKKGANAGNTFWGCSTFPKCRGIIGSV